MAFITNNTIQNQQRAPGIDIATIVTHGVAGSPIGFSRTFGWSIPLFQNPIQTAGLNNNDFYEHTWGGFDITGFGIAPNGLQHAIASISMIAATNLVFAKGYAEVNIASHSWGSAVSHQAINSGLSAPINDWVTFGSPLRANAPRPVGMTGNWGDLYSDYDGVTWLQMFPPFQGIPNPTNTFAGASAIRMATTWRRDLSGILGVPAGTPIGQWYFYTSTGPWVAEHGAYWNDIDFLTPVVAELR